MKREKSYKEHVYSLEEKRTSEISPLWQILQVVFYLCSVSCGFAVSYCFSNVMETMNQNCILYSRIVFYNDSHHNSNVTHNIKSFDSDFHSHTHCNIVIFIPVLITCFGSFFMVLFVICGRGGTGNKSLPDTWRIIMPTIIFNLISFCLSLFSANSFQRGLETFMLSFAKPSRNVKLDIHDLINLHLDGIHVGKRLVHFLMPTKYALWMLVSFWGLNFFWIFLRCMFNVDFQLVRTTIHVYPKNCAIVKRSARRKEESDNTSLESSELREVDSISSQHDSTIRFRTVQFSPSTKNLLPSYEPRLSDASTSTPKFDETDNPTDSHSYSKTPESSKMPPTYDPNNK